MTSTREAFGHDTTTDEVLEGIDLSGKLALVTGASAGLGAETARALASRGAEVVITARNMPKGEEVARQIRAATGNAAVEVEELELGSVTSIRNFAERFLERHASLNILINNAGVMACPFDKTEDGFELQFGTNHLGHFLMTCLIAPALERGGPARVVSLSSRAHTMSDVFFDDVNFEHTPYNQWLSYGQSKTANVLFAVELERRLGHKGVHAYAVHPGVIETELTRHMGEADYKLLQDRAAERKTPMQTKTVSAGAATSIYAATAPELDGRGGTYLEDCGIAPVSDDEKVAGGVRSYAIDPQAAERLWAISEKMLGQSFPL